MGGTLRRLARTMTGKHKKNRGRYHYQPWEADRKSPNMKKMNNPSFPTSSAQQTLLRKNERGGIVKGADSSTWWSKSKREMKKLTGFIRRPDTEFPRMGRRGQEEKSNPAHWKN